MNGYLDICQEITLEVIVTWMASLEDYVGVLSLETLISIYGLLFGYIYVGFTIGNVIVIGRF